MPSRQRWSGDNRKVTLFWVLMLLLTAGRLYLAGHLELSSDEAYYWFWSQHLQMSYLDHPPMIALMIRAGCDIFGPTELGIRVFGPLLVLVGTYLLTLAGKDLYANPTVGYRAALLLNATLLIGVGAATATPDTPLVFLMSALLWALGRLYATGRAAWWLAIGALLGLAFDSKYTAVLPAFAIGVWWVTTPSRWVEKRWVFGASLVGLVVASPVIVWNFDNNWVSFLKQGGRVGVWHPMRAAQFLSELAFGQLGLATPFVFIAFVMGTFAALRLFRRCEVARLISLLILIPVAVFVLHALGDRVQANWPAILYPVCALAAAALPWRVGAIAAFGIALSCVVFVQAIFAPLPLSGHLDVIARQCGGWRQLARDVEAQNNEGEPIVTQGYGLAAILAYYSTHLRIYSEDPRWAYLPTKQISTKSALLLTMDRGKTTKQRSVTHHEHRESICRRGQNGIVACYILKSRSSAEKDKRLWAVAAQYK